MALRGSAEFLNWACGWAADMVGHTGDLQATTRACALVDACVKELLATVDSLGGRWLVRLHGCLVVVHMALVK